MAREKTERIDLRVTPEEKQAIIAMAATAGMSVAAYILGNSLGDKIADEIIRKNEKLK